MPAPDIQQSVQRLFSDHLELGGHRKTPERFAISLNCQAGSCERCAFMHANERLREASTEWQKELPRLVAMGHRYATLGGRMNASASHLHQYRVMRSANPGVRVRRGW